MTDTNFQDEVFARLDGLYVAIEGLRRDYRQANGAINDFARKNVTPGEVAALHTDVDKIQTKLLHLEARLAVIEATCAERERRARCGSRRAVDLWSRGRPAFNASASTKYGPGTAPNGCGWLTVRSRSVVGSPIGW